MILNWRLKLLKRVEKAKEITATESANALLARTPVDLKVDEENRVQEQLVQLQEEERKDLKKKIKQVVNCLILSSLSLSLMIL